MSLAKAELRRLGKRRLTRLVLALLVLGLGGIIAAFSVASHHIGPAERAAAEAGAQRDYEEQLGFHQRMVAECEAAEARGEQVNDRYPPDCGKGEEFAPRREQFSAEWHLPYQFDFGAQYGVFISVLAGIMALVGFLVGASYVGAEWSSGGMMNLLLWRPRRQQVLLTKLGVLLGATLTVTVLLGAVWTLAFWLIGRYDGVTGTVTSGVWQSYALTGLRGIGLVLMVTAIAFGLASLGRHTAMALGVAVGVGVIAEIGLRIVFGTTGVPFGERFIPSTYVLAWFLKKLTLSDWNSCQFSQGECNPAELVVTWQQSGLVFGVATVAVLAAAFWAIRRRDVV
jgi:ABC-2 type transport system permease protein